MGICDLIAEYIYETVEKDGKLEMQRGDLADLFRCVPSQVNYVLATRFSPERGYIVESRRGGGGYIRVMRVTMDQSVLLMHAVNSIGDSLLVREAMAIVLNLTEGGILDETVSKVISAAVSENALRPVPLEYRCAARAALLKQCLLGLGR